MPLFTAPPFAMATQAQLQPASVPVLSFPPAVFAAVSPRPFLQAHLTASKSPLRANGRTAQEFRTPGVNSGSLTHCLGSAVVRLGNTSVVCGVRGEILKEEDAQANTWYLPATPESKEDAEDDEGELEREVQTLDTLRLLVPNIELSTGSTPQHLPGSAPSSAAQTLITRIRSLLLSTHLVRLADLLIPYTPPSTNPDDPYAQPETEIKAYWTLYIDIFFISLDGCAFDAAWCSVLAALRDTRLPRAFWDEELETVLCSDEPGEARTLSLRGLPIPVTFAVFEGRKAWADKGEEEEEESGEEQMSWVLSDPDAFEEGVCKESVCVVVDGSAATEGNKATRMGPTVRRIEKSGGGVVDRGVMRALVKQATERWSAVEKVLRGTE